MRTSRSEPFKGREGTVIRDKRFLQDKGGAKKNSAERPLNAPTITGKGSLDTRWPSNPLAKKNGGNKSHRDELEKWKELAATKGGGGDRHLVCGGKKRFPRKGRVDGRKTQISFEGHGQGGNRSAAG